MGQRGIFTACTNLKSYGLILSSAISLVVLFTVTTSFQLLAPLQELGCAQLVLHDVKSIVYAIWMYRKHYDSKQTL